MKVIFIEDVQNVARAGQTKEVADGYARNFLFPKKFAVLANSQAAASVDAHLKKLAKQRAIEEAEMAAVAKKIGGLEITLKAKVGENDKLYGSITGADIAEALSKSAGCVIDKKVIVMPEPIKQTGVCDVTVRFTHDITAVIKVNVISEDATEEKPAKAEKKQEKAEAPAEEKKAEKKEKAPRAEKAAEEKPVKEKKTKAPKAEKAVEEKPAEAVKEEKPAKEKKAKAAKAEKVEKPAEEKPAEEKKEKKPRAKAKKTEE